VIHFAVNFHYVGMPAFPHPGIHGLSIPEFRECLLRVAADWEPVALTDVLDAVGGRSALPDKSCLITFDDGMLCQYQSALPVLEETGIPAAFFIMAGPYLNGSGTVPLVHKIHWCRANYGNAAVLAFIEEAAGEGWIDARPAEVDLAKAARLNPYDDEESSRLKYFLTRSVSMDSADRIMNRFMERMDVNWAEFIRMFFMSEDMIRDLAGRGMIGSHAVAHVPLARAPRGQVRAEMRDSRSCIEAICGREIRALSYPYGIADSVNREVASEAAAAGYEMAYTMERAHNATLSDPLLLARIDCRDAANMPSYGDRRRYCDA
jgi:peptidoglycan/xylan/chitin deacetylase (PgdA/CDA1 family)